MFNNLFSIYINNSNYLLYKTYLFEIYQKYLCFNTIIYFTKCIYDNLIEKIKYFNSKSFIKNTFNLIRDKVILCIIRIFCYFNRYEMIENNNELQMQIFYLFSKKTSLPFNLLVKIYSKANYKNFHNSKNDSTDLILYGKLCYCKENGDDIWLSPFNYLFNKATTFHKIKLNNNSGSCYTISLMGRNYNEYKVKEFCFENKFNSIDFSPNYKIKNRNPYVFKKRYNSKKVNSFQKKLKAKKNLSVII